MVQNKFANASITLFSFLIFSCSSGEPKTSEGAKELTKSLVGKWKTISRDCNCLPDHVIKVEYEFQEDGKVIQKEPSVGTFTNTYKQEKDTLIWDWDSKSPSSADKWLINFISDNQVVLNYKTNDSCSCAHKIERVLK